MLILHRCLGCASALFLVAASDSGSDEHTTIQLRCPAAAQGLQINSLHLDTTDAKFDTVSQLPADWTLQISDEPSSRLRLDASAGSRSTGLRCADLERLKVTIRNRRLRTGDVRGQIAGTDASGRRGSFALGDSDLVLRN